MKRLLAYLFMILGLGLVFNANTNANEDKKNIIHVTFCNGKSGIYPTSYKCARTWQNDVVDQPTTYEVFLIKANKPICYSKNEDRVQLRNKCFKDSGQYEVKYDGKNFYWGSDKTQIAKAEPSQTEKVNKKTNQDNEELVYFCDNTKSDKGVKFFITKYKSCNVGGGKFWASKRVTENEYIKSVIRIKKKSQKDKYFVKRVNKLITEYQSFDLDTTKLELVKILSIDDLLVQLDAQTLITENKDTVIKPKEEVKVVKKEPKKEEFKPKKTNQDNEAPVIKIAETVTSNDASYEFQGDVSDQAEIIYVEVDGRIIDVDEGKFIVKGYSPVDKQISIEAIDQWGNRSETKIVKLIIDLKDTNISKMFESLDPSKIQSNLNKNRVALIIGIEKYDQTPDATYANLDAQYFYEYARKSFGISKSNIKLLVDEDANLIKSLGTLNKWLPSKIKSGQTELIIFFAGHGLASSDGKELYLLPQDSDPDLLARTALSRGELFKEIIKLKPKSVTMFLDTCYSGVSRDEKTLLASARPVRIIADEQETPNNFTIFSASQIDQISSGLKEAKHGIFSYYLMKGLEGYADANKDKNITNGELLAYMDENVSQKASELGRQQNPSLLGDPDKILINY